MLDQNTDRMWYVIGAIIIGGLILTSSIVLFTDVAFASVQDAFSMFSNVVDVSEIPDYYVLATDDDFEWVVSTNENSYNVNSESESGYYRYIGDNDYVIIPKKINNDEVRSYYSMFRSYRILDKGVIKGVANQSGDIESMRSMLASTDGENIEMKWLNVDGVSTLHNMFGVSNYDVIDFRQLNVENVSNIRHILRRTNARVVYMTNFNFANIDITDEVFYNTNIDELYVSTQRDKDILMDMVDDMSDVSIIVELM